MKTGGILVLTSVNLEKKGLILMSSVLPWKGVFIWAEKSVFYRQKRGFILNWNVSVLLRKRGRFELKGQCFAAKGGHFQTGEKGWVPLFPVSEGARGLLDITCEAHGVTVPLMEPKNFAIIQCVCLEVPTWK